MALKAAYPTLPVTSNCLDPRQRAQLLRSSKKLAKVLGATPRFVDAHSEEPEYTFCESEDSFESSPTYAPSTISSRPSSSSSISELLPRGGSRHGRSNSEPPSPTRPVTPLMRVTLPTTQEEEFSSRPQFLSRTSSLSSSSSNSPPVFSIPSSQAQKRAKMDRLRRKFGDEIPIELVFPTQPPSPSSSSESDEEEEQKPRTQPIQVISERGAQFIVVQGFDIEKPLPFLPPPSPIRKNSPRDSLLVHRIRRKMVCYQDENEKEGEFRLSLIMESPQAEDYWR